MKFDLMVGYSKGIGSVYDSLEDRGSIEDDC
jgi:hypothetical protein